MIKLIQDLTAFGPVFFSIILVVAFSWAGWLIASLQHKKRSEDNRFTHNETWILRKNLSRLKSLRHS